MSTASSEQTPIPPGNPVRSTGIWQSSGGIYLSSIVGITLDKVCALMAWRNGGKLSNGPAGQTLLTFLGLDPYLEEVHTSELDELDLAMICSIGDATSAST